MMFNENDISSLRIKLEGIMSVHRYNHTLGVERAAKYLGAVLMPERVPELSVAALLHDVAKELPKDEQLSLALTYKNREITEEANVSDQILHAFAAPGRILRDFPEFATNDVLRSTFLHTTGAPDMTLFDKIIFVADFVEENRTFNEAIELREWLYSALSACEDVDGRVRIINQACIREIDSVIKSLERRGLSIDGRTIVTRKAIASLI
jgi:predicted HD superfamily hydrolase involved in NAD metabolism